MGCCDNTPTDLNCQNPCAVSASNTPTCESLPSQIENFSTQFFGTVVKTSVDGAVRWTLPCSLETGLENNPRLNNEGLACYFLRLFDEGIVGATGPAGAPGTAGAAGNNAYTVTLQGFTQPTIGSPNVVIRVSYNPVVLAGLYIFVQGSGWYLVTNTDTSGNVWATLQRPLSGASGTINAGRLVVPCGFPGESIIGPQGPQGPKGDQGDSGVSYTETRSQVAYPLGTDDDVEIAYQAVNVVSGQIAVLLPNQGTYKITCTVAYEGNSAPNDPAAADVLSVKLYDTSDLADVPMSEQTKNDIVADSQGQLTIDVQYTTSGDTKTVSLYAKCTSASKIKIIAARTSINYVRLA